MVGFSNTYRNWRLALGTSVAFALMTVLASCPRIPDLNNSPRISDIRVQFVKNTTGFIDTVFISLSYEDGDGNLGLASSDTSAPFQLRNANGTINLNHYNIIVTPEVKAQGARAWQTYNFPCPNPPCANSFNSRFPVLNDPANKQPIKGRIVYNIPSLGYPYDSAMRFNVYIQDRALNKSNTLTSDSILIQ